MEFKLSEVRQFVAIQANLLCDANWRAYVGDFGFSRIKAELRTMTRCGTLFYSAPELLEGKKYGEAVDVYVHI